MRLANSIAALCLAAGSVFSASGCTEKRHEARKEASRTPVEVNSNPESLLKEGAMEKIQDALAKENLQDHWKRGKLDPPTSTAIRKLQKKKSLPATGVPDGRTVMALGLSPDEILKRRPLE